MYHEGCVNAVNFNSTGSLIASGSDDLKIAIWDWVKHPGEPVLAYPSGHIGNVFQVYTQKAKFFCLVFLNHLVCYCTIYFLHEYNLFG